MASPKTKPTARRPRPTRKAAPAKAPARARTTQRTKAAASPSGLPSWGDLAAKKGVATRPARAPKAGLVAGVPTLRFALLVAAVCALLTLYVGHVYATQALAAEVQQLQRENDRLVLKHNRLQGEFDRMTSPSVILGRAEALGLASGSEYGPTINVQTP